MSNTYTAFDGNKILMQGSLDEVVLKVKRRLGKDQNCTILIFSDTTGKSMDFNFQGSEADVVKRLEVFVSDGLQRDSGGPGRPKLGVVSREVSLLPRHWEWLASQTAGSSAVLRSLVQEAMKKSASGNETKLALERTHKFMTTMAGDFAGFEEALRALFKKDQKKFLSYIENWPADVRTHILELSEPVF